MEDAARRLFLVPPPASVTLLPAPTLAQEEIRTAILDTLRDGGAVIVFLQSKLGGEISLSPTDRSPEVSFDTTMIQLSLGANGMPVDVGKFGILEVQTMDFHGTYKHAVKNILDALRLHEADFHRILRENRGKWISDRIEGPNIANVFKRTFYQMMLKFQIGAHESSAGCVLALPAAVWDSWQRHLGKPELTSDSTGISRLAKPGAPVTSHVPAWIYVFDIDATSSATPNPLIIQRVIATDADSVAFYAVKVAPEVAIARGGAAGALSMTIRRRLGEWWPVLGGPTVERRRRPPGGLTPDARPL